MKKLLSLCLFLSVYQHAQINRFAYVYEFKPDSTNRSEVKKETMFLDISEKGSRFHSHEKMIQDSIIKEQIQKQISSGMKNLNINRQGNSGQFFDYVIDKNYPDYKTTLTTGLGMDRYKVLSSHKFNWKISPEKSKIGNYETQKATTHFGGRTWIAWFTTEIPFQEGPYKFHGLPGMILKVKDTKDDHVFTFSGNTVVSGNLEEGNFSRGFTNKLPIEITEDKFNKLWKEWKIDPLSGLKQMMLQQGVEIRISIEGKDITDPNEMTRASEKRAKELIKINNNPIELNLYK